jgi:GGDEF domain-containing protein
VGEESRLNNDLQFQLASQELALGEKLRAALEQHAWQVDFNAGDRDWSGGTVDLAVDGALLVGLGDRNEIDNELIQQASDLASRVGVALAAHAREAQLVYRAHHDDLTGLPNRALLQERLQLEMARARRNGEQLAVLFLDQDRFKAVNDTLGHQAGDQVLRVATERLRSCLRDCDTVARFGGDEFVVLLSV